MKAVSKSALRGRSASLSGETASKIKYARTVKAVLIGEGACGKTAFLEAVAVRNYVMQCCFCYYLESDPTVRRETECQVQSYRV